MESLNDYYTSYSNEFCPHIQDHFLNTYMNRQHDKIITLSNPSTTSNPMADYPMRNISMLINSTIASKYYGYNQQQSLIDSFFLQNYSLNWIAMNNPQNLSFSSINRDGCIFTVRFDDLGSSMAISNHLYNIEVWDLPSRKIKKVITEHKEIVTGVEYFHNQSDMFMSCSLDKSIKIWKDYKCAHTFIEHSDWIRSIAISEDNKFFLSGCVASVVKLWDIQKQKVIGSIVNQNPFPESLSTVNSLGFKKRDEYVFLAGLRSGEVKLFDTRLPHQGNSVAIASEFKAHHNKLNSVKFNESENYLLSSGRDSLLRLWDTRKLPQGEDANANAKQCVNEYKGHRCVGFNIDCNFFQKEKYIITGSEDSHIYIYDTQTAKVAQKIPTMQRCINLVRPIPRSHSFAFTGLEDLSIFIWDVTQSISKKITQHYDINRQKPYNESKDNNCNSSYSTNNPNDDIDDSEIDLSKYQDKETSQQLCTKLIEDVMAECGDLILKIFHSHNLTYSNGISFDHLNEVIRKSNDQESINILNKINERFMARLMDTCLHEHNARKDKENDKHKPKNETKPIENNHKVRKIQCLKCSIYSIPDIKKVHQGFDCSLLNLPVHNTSAFSSPKYKQLQKSPQSQQQQQIDKSVIMQIDNLPMTKSNYLINKC